MARLATVIASVGGIGYAPFAPGTVMSAVAMLPALVMATHHGAAALFLGASVIFALGIWACGAHLVATGREDPSECVIDELAGQWLACAFALPTFGLLPSPQEGLYFFFAAFVLFRLFDIWKPWPVGWADRSLKGGLGVMADDMLAGLMAGLCVVALRFMVPL